jgi:hypothetical protein
MSFFTMLPVYIICEVPINRITEMVPLGSAAGKLWVEVTKYNCIFTYDISAVQLPVFHTAHGKFSLYFLFPLVIRIFHQFSVLSAPCFLLLINST